MTADAVLFDLDGTLVDTAPDLVAVLNEMLAERGRPRMPYAIARNVVSNGARGLIELGFGAADTLPDYETLRAEFLSIYARGVCNGSRLFFDLQDIARAFPAVAWGIVTNKPTALTHGLLAGLGIDGLPGAVIGGDRLPQRKPHPAPLLLAAQELGVPPERCIYVGDAPRDIEAGKAAGMRTVVAAYGYISPLENVRAWAADAVVRHPAELCPALAALGVGRCA